MNILDVKKHIQSGSFDHLYIFTGIELEVQRIYVNRIAQRSESVLQRVYSINDIIDSLKRKSLLNRPICAVVRDDKEFTQNEKLQDNIEKLIGDNIVILLYTNLDKRTKFYKKYKDRIVEFEPLPEHMLIKYIHKEITLSDDNCKKLIEICESDYGRILLEIDKIKKYVGYTWNKRDVRERDGGIYWTNNCFETLLADRTIYQPPKDAVFDFVDAVLKGKIKKSFELLNESYACGEATLVLLSVLYTNARQVLQVQTCESKDIEKSTGLTAWQIKCAKEKCNVYLDEELIKMLKLIQKVESGIKTGEIDDNIAVKYILVNIM